MIPDNYILPGNIVCPDLGENTVARDCCPTVFFAPKSPSGTAADLSVNNAVSKSSATTLFGADSIAKAMVDAYKLVNPFGELTVIPYTPTGTASVGSVTIAGTATEAGVLIVYVNNTFVQVGILNGDTAADVASALAAELNLATTLPVTATNASGVVTITAKVPGNQGDMIQLSADVEVEGLSTTTVAMTGGAGAPDYSALLDAMGDCCCFDFLGYLDQDETYMDLFKAFYGERWGCECFVGGRYYNTFRGTYTGMITYLDDRKGKHPFGSTMYVCEAEQAADYQKLATMLGYAHLSTCADPAKTWYKGELTGIPNVEVNGCGESCLTKAERNNIAYRGGMTTINGPQGYQLIEADVGLGSINGEDEVDLFLRYPQAAYQTMRFARLFAEWAERFDGLNISSTEINPPQGVEVLTPNMFTVEYKGFLRPLEGTLIENVDSALELVQFQQNSQNPSRADVCVFFDPISAFRQFAVTLKPRINLQEFS